MVLNNKGQTLCVYKGKPQASGKCIILKNTEIDATFQWLRDDISSIYYSPMFETKISDRNLDKYDGLKFIKSLFQSFKDIKHTSIFTNGDNKDYIVVNVSQSIIDNVINQINTIIDLNDPDYAYEESAFQFEVFNSGDSLTYLFDLVLEEYNGHEFKFMSFSLTLSGGSDQNHDTFCEVCVDSKQTPRIEKANHGEETVEILPKDSTTGVFYNPVKKSGDRYTITIYTNNRIG